MAAWQKYGKGILAAAVLCAACVCGGCGREPEKPSVSVHFLMDTVIEQHWYGDGKEAFVGEVQALLSGFEQRASPYLESSELAALNAQAGKGPVRLSGDILEMLAQAKRYSGLSRQSGGGFDITVGPLVREWNVMGDNPHVPPEEDIARLVELVDYRDLQINGETGEAMLLREGQAVDPGAVAKGYACDLIAGLAEEHGGISGYVTVGSNVLCLGRKPVGSAYRFGIRDPNGGTGDYIGVVELPWTEPESGNVYRILSTSGTYERFFMENGVRYPHVMDANTGRPVQNGLISVTILCYNGLASDCLSTDFLIRGVQGVLEELSNPAFAIIAVDEGGTVYLSDHIREMYRMNEEKRAYRIYENES